jgi:nucleotide-binding universal stress UspA family protein
MTTVLAAIDASPAARPVLETARRIARALSAEVEVFHVAEPGVYVPSELPERLGLTLRVVGVGPGREAADVLLDALQPEDVVVGVVGARARPGGAEPAGHLTLDLLERSRTPLVVVPPDSVEAAELPPWQVLLPLGGDEAESRAVVERVIPLLSPAVELVVLHVITTDTVPVLDHPEWGLGMWTDEFLARYCPTASRIDVRTGSVGARIMEACHEIEPDMIALSWLQDASAGHAAVVRDVLARSTRPVMLVPVGPEAPGPPADRATAVASPTVTET